MSQKIIHIQPDDLIFEVPPGIGDISWVYSKLHLLPRKIGFRILTIGTNRALPFVNLLPGIDNLGYGNKYRENENWLDPNVDLSQLPAGTYKLMLNPSLESGMKLADAFPKQETNYHYPINTTQRHKTQAKHILDSLHGWPKIGFYCSSHVNAVWQINEWIQFLTYLNNMFPELGLVAIGASYDDLTEEVYEMALKMGFNIVSAVGDCEIGATIEILKKLDYFVAYPSGLAILADVVDTPCLMFYWKNYHDKFLDTYADPINISTGRHLNRLFCSVEEATQIFAEKSVPWIKIPSSKSAMA